MARIIYQTEYEREEMESAGIDFNQALRIIKGFMGTEDTLDALQGFFALVARRALGRVRYLGYQPYCLAATL